LHLWILGSFSVAIGAEYNNTGKGATLDRRVPWSKLLASEEAKKYTKENVLNSFYKERP